MSFALERMVMAVGDWLEEHEHDEIPSNKFALGNISEVRRDASKGRYRQISLSTPRVTLRVYEDWTVEEVEET